MNGYGYPVRQISAPDTGLYYLWVYFSGNNLKDIYGYILLDNLQPDIALDGITLAKTANVELGKTLTLKPTFNPSIKLLHGHQVMNQLQLLIMLEK